MIQPAGPRGTWIEVGALGAPPRDPSQSWRRRHWWLSSGFAVRSLEGTERHLAQPFLTARDARQLMISGQWYQARQLDKGLRLPDQLVSASQALHLDTPLTGVSFKEAERFATLMSGRLPREKEADLIATALHEFPPTIPQSFSVWTASPWSEFSYSACVWDMEMSRWREPAHARRIVPESETRRTVLRVNLATQEIIREPCEPSGSQDIAVWVVHGEPI